MHIVDKEYVNIILFEHFHQIHTEYSKLSSQKNCTCGPYSLSYILKGLGFETHQGNPIDEDYLAFLAQVHISEKDAKHSQKINHEIKEGLLSEQEARDKYPNNWYRYKLWEANTSAELGASCAGVINACERATEKKILALPIPAVKDGITNLTKERFLELTILFINKKLQWELQLIMNYRTNELLNVDHKDYSQITLLETEKPADLFGYDPWGEGHYSSSGGIIRRGKNFYYNIRDTYKNKGFKGYHLQPLDLLANALMRDDGREGGILLLIKREAEKEAQKEIENIGLRLSPWDNGSPFHKDKINAGI